MKLLTAALALALTACGGGGDAPAASASQCVPRLVTVALLGDSTQYGTDGSTTREGYFGDQAVDNPGARLQVHMDKQFGPGAVRVTNYGVPGSSSVDARKVQADVIVANYDINDMNGQVPLWNFEAQMRATGLTIAETQMPTVYEDKRELGYINTTKGLGLPVADVYSYVRSLPNWQSYYPDPNSAHVTNELYRMIADNVLAPRVAEQVAPLRCVR